MTYPIKYVFQKTEDLNLSVLNMITGINESKTLTNHLSCKCKCKFDGRKYNSNQWWKKRKKHDICEKVGILLTVKMENI